MAARASGVSSSETPFAQRQVKLPSGARAYTAHPLAPLRSVAACPIAAAATANEDGRFSVSFNAMSRRISRAC